MLDRIRHGDQTALGELLSREWDGLVRHLAAMGTSLDGASDIAQEAFVRLWEKRESWSGESAKALVFRIARNLFFDQHRKDTVRARWAADPASTARASVPTPEQDFESRELMDRISLALEDMPPRRGEVFRLVRVAGMSYAEVADAMGLSRQTVANQASRALADLRAALRDSLPNPQKRAVQEQNDG